MIDTNESQVGNDALEGKTGYPEFTGEVIEFAKKQTFTPNADYILLDYEPAKMAGSIVLPNVAKGLQWVTAKVVKVGPLVKFIKEGDGVVLAVPGIVEQNKGVIVNGERVFFTQEKNILAVVS